MWYYLLKILTSSVIIVLISEISKRSTLIASIFASIPLVSIMAFIWLYIDTKDVNKIASLSNGIFWMVIPSLLFFIIFPMLHKKNISFAISMILASLVMIAAYFILIFILKKFNINI